jgi:hypothetical protein
MDNGAPWLLDVSEHQGPDLRFGELWAEGFDGVIPKMTEGTGYIDPTGVENMRRIIQSSLIPGAYHFLWGGMSAVKQAEFFLRQIAKVVDPREVMLFLDVEVSSNMASHQHPKFSDVQKFLLTLQGKLPGKRLGIYSGYYWREDGWLGNPSIESLGLAQRPIIWDAHYFAEQVGRASDLYKQVPRSYWTKPAFGGAMPDILQFADTVKTDQFVGDGNACSASYADLREWSGRSRRQQAPLVRPPSAVNTHRRFATENTKRMVRDIEYRFPVQCFACPNHDRTGDSVDILVAPMGTQPNEGQHLLGRDIVDYVKGSWDRYNLDDVMFQDLVHISRKA